MNLNKNSKISKTIKLIIQILGGSFPLGLMLFVGLMAIIAAIFPIFIVTTMVGGSTVYGNSKSDLPNDVTINGVDEWTDEEKKIFDDLTKEKEYYDGQFSRYNAIGILKNEDEKLDVSTPISTVHYQGTVNLTVFDEEYFDSFFNEVENANEYNGEKNVQNRHTRDFYKKAGQRIGNTFMIYPGMRMLMGNLVKNSVDFTVVKCKENECTSSTFSRWSFLGKITSSNEIDAAKEYDVSSAINKVTAAIKYGEDSCINFNDEWKKENICYDIDLLFTELFGVRFSLSDQSIIEHLEEKYAVDNAKVPVESLINQNHYYPAGNYINVTVKKSIDYELYEKYLKEVYIPFVYINCNDCGYKDESEEIKQGDVKRISDEIMQLTNSFKHYNNEDVAYTSISVNHGSFGKVTPSIGYDYLPEEYYNQLIAPLVSNQSLKISSCVGYYDAVPNTKYYCTRHGAADIVGYGGKIVAPADGVVTYCGTNVGNWGPYLEITHTLKDESGNDVSVISYYRHWLDVNGNLDCSTFKDRVVKQGEVIAIESDQAGSYAVARHLHFGLMGANGTKFYIEDFLISKGVNTSSADGTTDCNYVRSVCNEYCRKNTCKST